MKNTTGKKNPFWVDITDAVAEIPRERYSSVGCAGFELARTVKGVLHRYGENDVANLGAFGKMISQTAGEWAHDPDELQEAFYFAWPKVALPAGVDVIGETVSIAKKGNRLSLSNEPNWPSPKFKADAEITLAVAGALSLNGERVFFISCRTLAAHLDCDPMRASRIIRYLQKLGYLEAAKKSTKHQATRLRLSNKAKQMLQREQSQQREQRN